MICRPDDLNAPTGSPSIDQRATRARRQKRGSRGHGACGRPARLSVRTSGASLTPLHRIESHPYPFTRSQNHKSTENLTSLPYRTDIRDVCGEDTGRSRSR